MTSLVPLTEDGSTPTLGRFVLLECDSILDLLQLPEVSSRFCLLTAFDLSETSEEDLRGIARALVDRGLAYASCWGQDCERLHDAIDHEGPLDWEEDRPEGTPPDVLMTTWHDGEPLEEALFFFGRLALPTPKYAVGCRDYIIACTPNYVDVVRAIVPSRTR